MPAEHPQPANATIFPSDRRALLAGIGGIAAGALLAGKAHAGPLTPPPGPIAPTPGPEPRIPIGEATTPGDATCLFRITQPGSYYLTGNVQAPPSSTKHGIIIQSDAVSIDLMGFALTGVPTSGDGIRNEASAALNALSICNGTVNRWGGRGIRLTSLTGSIAAQSLIERIRASNNQGSGIDAGNDPIILTCIAESNGSNGISCSRGVVARCAADSNAGTGVSGAAIVTDCRAYGNGGDGFFVLPGGVATNSSSRSNGLSGFSLGSGCSMESCCASVNGAYGIEAESRSVIRDCSVNSSGRSNIIVNSSCTVRGVTSSQAGQTQFAAAILVTGSANRIEDNHCVDSDVGIQVQGTGNFIARNTSGGNFTNWIVVAGNTCLVVQASTAGAISGNAGGASPGSTNPNANYTL